VQVSSLRCAILHIVTVNGKDDAITVGPPLPTDMHGYGRHLHCAVVWRWLVETDLLDQMGCSAVHYHVGLMTFKCGRESAAPVQAPARPRVGAATLLHLLQ
jgi:hypothetical protein